MLSLLLAATRELLDDETQPYLWLDAALTRYLNNAVRETCLRARLLKDDADSQPGICTYAITAGTAIVPFDRHIIVPRSGSLVDPSSGTGCGGKLWALTAESMDRMRPGWDTQTSTGRPEFMVMDLTQKTLRLYPTPDVDYSLRLRVWREPLSTELMESPNSFPVIQVPGIEELKHWAAHEAFLRKDAETEDRTAAATHLELFEQRFGTRPSIHEIARWADSPPRVRNSVLF